MLLATETPCATNRRLITANTDIYVTTTGSDTTGTGSAAAPYASIAAALASIAGALVAPDVGVTINVADGEYTISEAIDCGHPSGYRISLRGNDSTETALAIATISAATKTFTITGDYAASFPVGDVFRIVTGTEANKGVYSVASAVHSEGTTTVVVNEVVASDTVGGAYIKVMPSNRCVLNVASTISCFTALNSPAINIYGFRINSPSNTTMQAVYPQGVPYWTVRQCIIVGFRYAAHCGGRSFLDARYIAALSQSTNGLRATLGTANTVEMAIGGAASNPIVATQGAFIRYQIGGLSNNGGSNLPSPAFVTDGNYSSYISNV